MGKILEALYEGNLLAEPIVEKRSKEHLPKGEALAKR